MNITCGKYKHFKGKRYMVYGVVSDNQNKEFVLYQKKYGDKSFWIRPISMFAEEVENNGNNIKRFELITPMDKVNTFNQLVSIAKEKSITIFDSETEKAFRIFSIDTDSFKILLYPYESFSSYLTDTQIAWRMGYDYIKIDNEKYIIPTNYKLPAGKQLIIDDSDAIEKEYKDKEIIKNLNPCSIDLHISDHFFSKSRHKTIDIASMMRFSVKASELWKDIRLKTINGFKAVVIKPGETIITHTLERIELPYDCSGKIEIKSTYARLSLSVTTSDFCNPGWKGYFPLAITNNSNHKIVLHPREEMLQFSLVQTDGSIINEYSQNATYNDDDGTPYKFWHAQTIKHLQKECHSDEILEFYKKVLKSINDKNSENVDAAKSRFCDTFLLFCERKIKNGGYNSIRDAKNLLKKIWKEYKKSESIKKVLFGKVSKILTQTISFIPTIILACLELFVYKNLDWSLLIWLIATTVFAGILELVWHVFAPKYFCTFEKLEFDYIYKIKNT